MRRGYEPPSAFVRRLDYESRQDVFVIWFIGDLHVGSAACDERALRSDVDAIRADPRALWVGLGDLCEYIPMRDWRYRQSQLAHWVRGLDANYCDDVVASEIERVVELLSPIREKCLGLVAGNHEDHILGRFDRDVQREVCTRLQVDNLGCEAWIRLLFHRAHTRTVSALDMYVHHGWFAGRKDGAKINNLQEILLSWDVDIAAVGHGHVRAVAPPVITYSLGRNGQVRERVRYALMAGSYAHAHGAAGSYSARKGYRPNAIGSVRVFYMPDRGTLWSEV